MHTLVFLLKLLGQKHEGECLLGGAKTQRKAQKTSKRIILLPMIYITKIF